MSTTDDRLIERYITDVRTTDPRKRNEPVITSTGTPVWVVVAYCQRARKGSVKDTAKDYHLKEEEVQAALAYHCQHPELDILKGEEGDRAA
jgi:uncharacterized protein (DUF433 family)